MSQINWNLATKQDAGIIGKIAKRACEELEIEDRIGLSMDITATHICGTPLDLEKLMTFDKFNFAHDIHGIMGYLNREDGKLKRGFLPRCSK